jgi:hypothetical protein
VWLEYLLLRARPLRWKRDREILEEFLPEYIQALSIASSCWWIKRKRGERESRERKR